VVREGDIQGHWARRWLRAPGFEDATTRVHWMQAGGVYADVRVPLERPDLGQARCLAEMSTAALAELLSAEGFAGTTEVADSVCTWTRHINWHGATEDVDAGRLSFDAAGDLIEDGVHADYAELWTRPAQSPCEGVQLSGSDMTAYLVSVGDQFVFGLGTPNAPPTDALQNALAAGERPDAALADVFDRVHIYGRWQGAHGIAELATNPFLEGLRVLTSGPDGVVFHHIAYDGAVSEIPLVSVSQAMEAPDVAAGL